MSLKPQDRSKLSPMMQQNLSMKDEHRDQILMFRLGDFYEMFYDDAILASKELELTLTGRLQSRTYLKNLGETSETRTAYELSVSACERIAEPAIF